VRRSGYDDLGMALSDLTPDPIDRDIELLLADPGWRARLDESEARHARGETAAQPRSHNEARRIVGLPPLSDDDPNL
jgi:hypothetical protein